MNTDGQIVLDAHQVARWLKLSTSTLAKMRINGTGPAYCKLGRRVVYRRRDIESWIQKNVRRSTSEHPSDQTDSGED